MIVNLNNVLTSIFTAGILGLCTIAWQTYNQFIVFTAKIDFVIEKLEYVASNEKEIFQRLNDLEKKLAKIEK
jgi:hypothetical protein